MAAPGTLGKECTGVFDPTGSNFVTEAVREAMQDLLEIATCPRAMQLNYLFPPRAGCLHCSKPSQYR